MNAVLTAAVPRTVLLAGGPVDFEEVAQAFDAWCAKRAGSACEVAVSGFWMRCCMAPAEAGHLSPADLRDYARRQFEHYFGEAPTQGVEDGWHVAASSDPRLPLACGMSSAQVARLLEAARRHRVRIRRLAPWWVRGAARLLPANGTLIASEPGLKLGFHVEADRLQHISMGLSEATGPAGDDLQLWPGADPMPLACEVPTVVALIRGRVPQRSTRVDRSSS